MPILPSVENLITLIKNGMDLRTERYVDLDPSVKAIIDKWMKDNSWNSESLEDLNLDNCAVALLDKVTVYIFYLSYDGSGAAPDPGGGPIVFLHDGSNVSLLYENVQVGN